MAIPNLPPFYDMKWVDESASLTPEALLHQDETYQTLNQAVSTLNSVSLNRVSTDGSTSRGTIINDGITIPNKTTVKINEIEPNAPLGTIWFDTDAGKLKVKTASGIIETITSS